MKDFIDYVGPVSFVFLSLSLILLIVAIALVCLPLTIPSMLSGLIGLFTQRGMWS